MTKKILAIGNAIVDVLCKVDDDFLSQNNLVKGSMSLIDENVAEKLSSLPSEKTTSGGSAGNTIAAIAQFGISSAFIGKVANDDFGKKFITEISKTGCKFLNKNFSNELTAKSFILVTPDAQRTMCTFLGCASQITEDDIRNEDFKDVSTLYLEGYLWDAPETILALKKAIKLAQENNVKIAFSLSDSFCVSRHKSDFLDLINNDLDILFANEDEAKELTPNFTEVFAKNDKLIAIITKSEKGCEVFSNSSSIEISAQEVENLTDTTGAGDAFAAGFLLEMSKDSNLEESAKFGNILASKIIQKFGARFEEEEIENLKNI